MPRYANGQRTPDSRHTGNNIGKMTCPRCDCIFTKREARGREESVDPGSGQQKIKYGCPECPGVWTGYLRPKRVMGVGWG